MENLVVSANKKFQIEKYVSQIKVVTQNNVKKVLSSSAKSDISACDCSNGMVTISGKIKVEMLYLSVENVVELAVGETDFIEKQKVAVELSNSFAIDQVNVSDVNYSSNEIICSVTHNTEINGIYDYLLPNFSDAETNVVADFATLKSSQFICSADDLFSVSEEDS